MTPTIDDYRWLIGESARHWLAKAADVPADEAPRLVPLLRKELTAERAHLVVEQVELRRRARHKFAAAASMFFTRRGLEQATDDRVAACKAERFALAGRRADLCCGIGGDSMALAAGGEVVGVDLDPAALLLAGANAAALGLAHRFTPLEVDVSQFAGLDEVHAWHCDPDRRPTGRRTTRGEHFQPPLAALDQLLTRNGNAAIKLAPATAAPPEWRRPAELEWFGSRGECRQQVAWFGKLVRRPGERSATVVGDRGAASIAGTGAEPLPVATELGRYLYEPQAAVLAAGLSGALAARHGLAALTAGVAYLTGDQRHDGPLLSAFEVHDILPFDAKQLKAYCRQRNLGRLELKKRGLEIDLEKLRRQVIGRGENAATLLISPWQGKVRVFVAERMS